VLLQVPCHLNNHYTPVSLPDELPGIHGESRIAWRGLMS